METPDTFCGQLTEAIMRIFWSEVKLETPQYNKAYSHVLKTLESMGLNEKMSKDYESVNNYKTQMRKRYQSGVDILESQIPNGMFSKDKDGDLVGINVLLKKIFCEMMESALEKERSENEKLSMEVAELKQGQLGLMQYQQKLLSEINEANRCPDIIKVEHERAEWSLKTFTEATALSSLEKCKEEIKEMQADIVAGKKEPKEFTDGIMCIFDSARRHGIMPEEIAFAYRDKTEVNKNRTWAKNPDNTYSHVKS